MFEIISNDFRRYWSVIHSSLNELTIFKRFKIIFKKKLIEIIQNSNEPALTF